MINIFGRYKEQGRAVIGLLLLAAGIIVHQELPLVAGAVLLAWGGYRLVSAWRSR
jgi:hypothetical protein